MKKAGNKKALARARAFFQQERTAISYTLCSARSVAKNQRIPLRDRGTADEEIIIPIRSVIAAYS